MIRVLGRLRTEKTKVQLAEVKPDEVGSTIAAWAGRGYICSTSA
jgi:hypothetical protein